MNRRDFLFFRTDRSTRVIDLSCQQLYMRLLDAQAASGRREDIQDAIPDPWGSEPPAELDERPFTEILDALEGDLHAVDVLRVRDSQWLACEDLRQALDGVLAPFKARGGRVEILDPAATSTARTPGPY